MIVFFASVLSVVGKVADSRNDRLSEQTTTGNVVKVGSSSLENVVSSFIIINDNNTTPNEYVYPSFLQRFYCLHENNLVIREQKRTVLYSMVNPTASLPYYYQLTSVYVAAAYQTTLSFGRNICRSKCLTNVLHDTGRYPEDKLLGSLD